MYHFQIFVLVPSKGLMCVLKIKLYEIGVSRCIIYDFFSIINEIILLVYGNIFPIVTMHMTTD